MTNIIKNDWVNSAKWLALFIMLAANVLGKEYAFGESDLSFLLVISFAAVFLLRGYEAESRNITVNYMNNIFRKFVTPFLGAGTVIILVQCILNVLYYNDSTFTTFTASIANGITKLFYASDWSRCINGAEIYYPYSVIWILPAIFWAELLFQLLLKLIKREKTLAIAAGSLSVAGYISSKIFILPFAIQPAMIACLFIWLGYTAKKYDFPVKTKYWHYIAAVFLVIVAAFFGYADYGTELTGAKDYVVLLILGLSGSLIIYLLAQFINRFKLFICSDKCWVLLMAVNGIIANTISAPMKYYICQSIGYGKKGYITCVISGFLLLLIVSVLAGLIGKYYGPIHSRLVLKSNGKEQTNRDSSIAVARGIFTILMLVGHYKIDISMTYLIYSCHMPAFVIFSGYFYKSDRSFAKTLGRMCRTFLLPYCFYILGVFLINWKSFSWEYGIKTIIQHICGISFADKLLSDIPSVGPVYFILMLFVIRVLYMLVDRIAKSEAAKNIIVLLLSLAGVLLANLGWWLPWSADVALYCLAFYRIGIILKKYKVADTLKNCHILVFVLGVLWAYVISGGGMEIAWRHYGSYFTVLLGATAGTLLVYKLSVFITGNIPAVKFALKWIGEWSLYVIIIHTLTRWLIDSILQQYFTEGMLPFTLISITIQILSGLVIKYLYECAKKICRRTAVR